jgi:hypothetical protein
VIYLQVRRCHPALDGDDETYHRVFPKRPKGYEQAEVRLGMKDGELEWVMTRYDPPPQAMEGGNQHEH